MKIIPLPGYNEEEEKEELLSGQKTDSPFGGMKIIPLTPEEQAELSARRLEAAWNSVWDKDPDISAENIQLSNKTRIPEFLIENNAKRKRKAQAEASKPSFGDMVKRYPATSSHLSIPKNLAISKDDLDNLVKTERLISEYAEQEAIYKPTKVNFDIFEYGRGEGAKELSTSSGPTPFYDIYKGFSNTAKKNRWAILSEKEMDGILSPQEAEEWERIKDIPQRISQESEGWNPLETGFIPFRGIGEFLGNRVFPLTDPQTFVTLGGLTLLGAGAALTSTGVGAPVGVPLSAAGTALTAGTLVNVMRRAAYLSGSMKYMSRLETQSMYRELLNTVDENGVPLTEFVDKPTLAIIAKTFGATAGLAEFLSAGVFSRYIPGLKAAAPSKQLAKLMANRTSRRVIVNTIKEWGLSLAAESHTEGVQRLITEIGSELARSLSAPRGGEFERMTVTDYLESYGEEVIQSAGRFLLGVGTGPMINLYSDMQLVSKAQSDQRFFEEIGGLETESKTKKRQPEARREFIDKVIRERGAPIDTVYIDGNQFVSYFQQAGMDPRAAARQLGIPEDEYIEAIDSGGRIKMDMADYATRFVSTEAGQALIEDVALGENDYTVREAKELQSEFNEMEAEAIAEAEKIVAQDEALNYELDYVRTSIHNLAQDLDVSDQEVERLADIYVHRGKAVLGRYGIHPQDWFDNLGLQMLRSDLAEFSGRSDQTLFQSLDARRPTAVGQRERKPGEILYSNLEAAKETPETLIKWTNDLIKETGIDIPLLSENAALKDVEATTEAVINRMVDNLDFIFEQVDPVARERYRQWYDGAHRVALRMAHRTGRSLKQTAAMIAVLSAQTEWFTNVSVAERVLETITRQDILDFKFDEKMLSALGIQPIDYEKETPEKWLGLTLREVLNGKKYSIDDVAKWIRAYDQAYNGSQFAMLTPTEKLRWSSYGALAKALSIYFDGSDENIDAQLGNELKIRNFFNNIYDPSNPNYLTVDTHAYVGALLRPAGTERLFGGAGSSLTGMTGVYPLVSEAYNRLAERKGLLPRETQSIVWEGIRNIFPDWLRRNKDFNKQVNKIWDQANKQQITEAEARQKILDLASEYTPKDKWFQIPEPMPNLDIDPKTFIEGSDVREGAQLMIELAPNPNNKEAVERWNQLDNEDKFLATRDVVWQTVGKILNSQLDNKGKPKDVRGMFNVQIGGYMDSTNPSISIQFYDKNIPGYMIKRIAFEIGYALNQESVMISSPKGIKGETEACGLISIPTGLRDIDKIHEIYTKIRSTIGPEDANEESKIINGHTTDNDGNMLFVIDLPKTDANGKELHGKELKALQKAYIEDLTDQITDILGVADGVVDSTAEHQVAFLNTTEERREAYVQERVEAARKERERREAEAKKKGKSFDDGGISEKVSEPSAVAAQLDYYRRASEASLQEALERLDQDVAENTQLAAEGAGGRSVIDLAPFYVDADGNVILVHFSRNPDLKTIQPQFYGTNKAGREKQRQAIYPDIFPERTYYALLGGGYRREPGLGINRYEVKVPLSSLYDIIADPEGFAEQAAEAYPNERAAAATYQEKLVKDAGYLGYISLMGGKPVAAVFEGLDPHQVTKVPVNKMAAHRGEYAQAGSESPQGAITFENSHTLIRIFETADRSTLLHETGHLFLQDLINLAQTNEQAALDLERINGWLGIEDWAKTTRDERIKAHEKFARHFEAYLMEGEAPTEELRPVFRAYKSWLIAIYKSIRDFAQRLGIDIQMNDEVKDIFNRLLATDEALEEAAGVAQYESVLEATEESKAKHRDAFDRAAELVGLLDTPENVQRHRKYIKEEVKKELESSRSYNALYSMQRSAARGGMKINEKEAIDLFGEDIVNTYLKPKKLTSKRSTWVLDDLALYFGYNSGQEMVEDIITLPPLNVAVERQTDMIMEQAMRVSQEEARAALRNADRVEALAIEMENILSMSEQRAQAESARQEWSQEHERMAAVRRRTKAAMDVARQSMLNKVASRLSPAEYIANAKRAAKKVKQALKDNNFEAAARYKDQEIINTAMAAAASEAKRETVKIGRYLNRMYRLKPRKGVDVDNTAIEKIHFLLDSMYFGSRKAKLEAETKSFLEWKRQQEEAGNIVEIPDRLHALIGRTYYKDLTYGDLLALRDGIKTIHTIGVLKNNLISRQKKRRLNEAVDDIVNTIKENTKGGKAIISFNQKKTDALLSEIRGLHASHMRIETIIRGLDGNVDTGTIWDYIFRPFVDAENEELVRKEQAAKDLQRLFEMLPRGRDLKKERFYPEVNAKLSRENLIAIALNWGNAEGRDRILNGNNWTEGQVNQLLSYLTDQDWDYVEAVWEYLDTFWPDVVALEKQMTGLEPKRVPAIEYTTSTGRVVSGGYYPLHYDYRKSPKFYEMEAEKRARDFMSFQFYRAQTQHGHTKARAEHLNRPLNLHINVLSRHVADVIHDLTHRRALYDVNKILNDSRVQGAMIDAIGIEMWNQFTPWLKNIASGGRLPPVSGWERILYNARKGVTIGVLGLKATTILVQPLSIFGSAERIGTKAMLHSILDFYKNPLTMKKKIDFVMERSVAVRNRGKTWDREIRDITSSLVGEGKRGRVMEMMFYGHHLADLSAVVPVWLEAFDRKMQETGNEKQAIYYADSIVNQTQPASSPKDLPSIMSGSEGAKLFTMFYRYFSIYYNLMASRLGMTKKISDLPKLAAWFLWTTFIPTILIGMIRGDEPDDDEDRLEWALKSSFFYPFQSIVGIRDIANYVQTPYWGYSASPAFEAPYAVGRLLNEAGQAMFGDDSWMDIIDPAIDVAGYGLKLPVGQARITIGQLIDYINSDDADFDLMSLFLRRRERDMGTRERPTFYGEANF